MSALPARWLDDPSADTAGDAAPDRDGATRDDVHDPRRRVTRGGQLRRRRARRRLVVMIALVAVVAAGVATYLLTTPTSDPFAGVWWEPSTGRRVELVADGDGYRLLYGAAKRSYAAERRGDDLVVAGPLGGDIVLRAKGDDQLVLKEGEQSSVLSRLPDDR
jgi:hypothetical protein